MRFTDAGGNQVTGTESSGRKSSVDYWDENWRRASDAGSAADNDRSSYFWQRIDRAIARALAGSRTNPETFLEVGAGASQWLPHLHARFGMQVDGLDYSEIGCERARQNLARAGIAGEIYHADMFNMPEHLRGKYDVVASFGLVEHFTDTASAIAACASCAKPGGIVITLIPNMKGLHGALYRVIDRKVFDTHVPLTLQDLERAHKDAGLNVYMSEHLLGLPGVADRNRDEPVLARRLLRRTVYECSRAYWALEARGIGVPENGFSSPYLICAAEKP